MIALSSFTFVVVGLTLIALGYFVAQKRKTFFNVVTFANFLWGLSVISVPVLLPGFPVPPFGVIYIFACLLGFSFWTLALDNFRRNSVRLDSPAEFILKPKLLNLLTVLCITLSVLAAINIFFIFKQNPALLLSNLLAASGKLAALRGNSDISIGIWGVIVANSAYLSAVLLAFRQAKSPLIILFHLIPALAATILLSQKLILLIAGLSWLIMSCILIETKFKVNQTRQKLRLSQKIKYGFIFFVFVGAIFLSFISREGYNVLNGEADFSKLFLAVRSYSIGSIVSFSYFFDDYLNIEWGGFGQIPQTHYSLQMGVFTFSGFSSNSIDTTYYISSGHPEVVYSNIYTIFRGLIYDFGVIGSILFVTLLGFLITLLLRPCSFGVRSGAIIASVYYLASYIFVGYLISPASARYTLLVAIELFILVAFVFPFVARVR